MTGRFGWIGRKMFDLWQDWLFVLCAHLYTHSNFLKTGNCLVCFIKYNNFYLYNFFCGISTHNTICSMHTTEWCYCSVVIPVCPFMFTYYIWYAILGWLATQYYQETNYTGFPIHSIMTFNVKFTYRKLIGSLHAKILVG